MLENGLAVSQLVSFGCDLLLSDFLFDKSLLVINPAVLGLGLLLLELSDVLLNGVLDGFEGTVRLFTVTVSLSGVSQSSVEAINTELLASDFSVAVLDLALLFVDLLLFLFKLSDEFVKLLLKELVLGGSVEVIDLDS